MSVIKSMPPAERPTEPLVYRPVSPLALASFILAGANALAMTALCGVSFLTGEPLPLRLWTLLFPVVAAVLAFLARRQIRNSEGTRSGLALANWAWWLSIVFGLGYGAICVGTYLAVTWQGRDFSTRWLELLRKGDVNAAFLLTQDPDQREGDNAADAKHLLVRYGMPEKGRRGPLPTFEENELVRILRQGGADVTIEELGVNSWEFDQGSYQLQQTFRLNSPEGTFDARVSVRSNDSRAVRRWQIWWEKTGLTGEPRLTELGKAVQRFRKDAVLFAAEWVQKRYSGDVEGAFLDTKEPAERARLRRESQACETAAEVAAAGSVLASAGQGSPFTNLATSYHPELKRISFLPGYRSFSGGDLVRSEHLVARKWRDVVNNELRGLFRFDTTVRCKLNDMRGRPLPLAESPDRYRIVFTLDFGSFPPAATIDRPRYQGTADLLVESDVGPITPQRTPQWRVVSLDLLTADDPPESPHHVLREGAGGAPPGRVPPAMN